MSQVSHEITISIKNKKFARSDRDGASEDYEQIEKHMSELKIIFVDYSYKQDPEKREHRCEMELIERIQTTVWNKMYFSSEVIQSDKFIAWNKSWKRVIGIVGIHLLSQKCDKERKTSKEGFDLLDIFKLFQLIVLNQRYCMFFHTADGILKFITIISEYRYSK